MVRRGMSGHQSAAAESVVWLTPPFVLDALGGWESFDLDPCACPEPRPWPTARRMISPPEDGLAAPWHGRVWLNPPYGLEPRRWLRGMTEGTALVFARTETEAWHRWVWPRASAVLFLEGRLTFRRQDGTPGTTNSGAPSALVAYGRRDAEVLAECGLKGAYVPLAAAREALLRVPDTWRAVVARALGALGGQARLQEIYRLVEHRRPGGTRFWRQQVRKQLRSLGTRTGYGEWRISA